jgi:hypothetical protein
MSAVKSSWADKVRGEVRRRIAEMGVVGAIELTRERSRQACEMADRDEVMFEDEVRTEILDMVESLVG